MAVPGEGLNAWYAQNRERLMNEAWWRDRLCAVTNLIANTFIAIGVVAIVLLAGSYTDERSERLLNIPALPATSTSYCILHGLINLPRTFVLHNLVLLALFREGLDIAIEFPLNIAFWSLKVMKFTVMPEMLIGDTLPYKNNVTLVLYGAARPYLLEYGDLLWKMLLPEKQ